MKTQLLFLVLASLILLFRHRTAGWSYAMAGLPAPVKGAFSPAELFSKATKLFFEGKAEIEAAIAKAAGDIAVKVKEISDPLDTRLKQIEEQIKAGGDLDPAIKEEVKNLAQKHEDLVKTMDSKLADLKTIRSDNEAKNARSLREVLGEEFSKKGDKGELSIVERIKGMAAGTLGKNSIDINLKAVADMSTAGNLTGSYFAGFDMRPGVTIRPLFDAHLRPTIPATTTEKPLIRYVRETTSEGGFDMVAEGALKPEIDWDFDIVDAPVRKIAGIFRVPDEMIDDIPYLLTYLTGRGLEELKNKEDQQILYGLGTGQELAGLNAVATAFAAGSLVVGSPNRFDVLVAAKKQLRLLNLVPNYAWVSPEDYAAMRLTKLSTGEYVFPVIPGTDTITVDGTPIVQNNRITAGTFFMLDTRYMEIADRMQSTVRLFDQDRDNVVKNLVTCVIEERLAFPIYRPQAVIKGTFAAAITDLTS